MNTDSRENYELVQYLIRSLMDDKQCSVLVTDTPDSDVIYVNAAGEIG
jgi:hypothetical protein